MSDPLFKSKVQLVLNNVAIIEERFQNIESAMDFISTKEGQLLMDAIAMRLQHIGETIKKLKNEFPHRFKEEDLDWDAIVRFRDFISHHYDQLQHDILFSICTDHIPPLKVAMNQLLTNSI